MSTLEYNEFLESKRLVVEPSGFEPGEVSPKLFDFQRDIVRWACLKGKAAIFAGTGLGKTSIQLAWADQVVRHTGRNVLILAPLAVVDQTAREGLKFGIPCNVVASQDDVKPGINVTNYEKLHKFDVSKFDGVVLDESSCIKEFTSATRNAVIESFRLTPYKLACTATPAPNDYMELGNHSEFLGVMNRTEMLSSFFVHDGGRTSQWRLKGHAVTEFWHWVASWAVMMQMPSDLGYEDNGFRLPPMNVNQIVVDKSGYIVREAATLQDRRRARTDSIDARVKAAVGLIDDEKWIVWCNLNKEQDALKKALGDRCVSIQGSTPIEDRPALEQAWREGDVPVLVTKPEVYGWGVNWQHCHNVAFVGLSDSFEEYYQAVRRCWRFGQSETVNVYVVTSEKEGAVVANIQRKEKEFSAMISGMISATQEITARNIRQTVRDSDDYFEDVASGEPWTMILGDVVEKIREIEDDSIHYTIFSPPFSSLYTYSNSARDVGNCRNDDEFFNHFSYLAPELYRVLMPGRVMSVHCMNLPMIKERDGVIGIRDFRGDLIRIFQKAGFIYHSEVCIWKNPVTAMQRTKALGLLHKQLKKDSCMSRQGIPDYLVTFRKPGINPQPVTHTNQSYPVSKWQHVAEPIFEIADGNSDMDDQVASEGVCFFDYWMDINPSDTLQHRSAREEADERHVAPLQLEVIRRALELWSNENDLVLSPFAGIGSEGYEAVKSGRRFVGIELKKSYYDQACANLKVAEKMRDAPKQVCLAAFEEADDAGLY